MDELMVGARKRDELELAQRLVSELRKENQMLREKWDKTIDRCFGVLDRLDAEMDRRIAAEQKIRELEAR